VADVPGQLPAAPGGRGAIFFSGQRAQKDGGKAWVFLDYLGPGWGGRPMGEGVPGLSHPLVNAANIPVETIEQQFPLNESHIGRRKVDSIQLVRVSRQQ